MRLVEKPRPERRARPEDISKAATFDRGEVKKKEKIRDTRRAMVRIVLVRGQRAITRLRLECLEIGRGFVEAYR
jgi:hypothetical protein